MPSKLAITINEHINARVQKSELSNIDLISMTYNITQFFNPLTVSDYAKANGLTYNGVLDRIKTGKLQTFEIGNTTFVIDNE